MSHNVHLWPAYANPTCLDYGRQRVHETRRIKTTATLSCTSHRGRGDNRRARLTCRVQTHNSVKTSQVSARLFVLTRAAEAVRDRTAAFRNSIQFCRDNVNTTTITQIITVPSRTNRNVIKPRRSVVARVYLPAADRCCPVTKCSTTVFVSRREIGDLGATTRHLRSVRIFRKIVQLF